MNTSLPSLTPRGRNACLALLGVGYLLVCCAVHAGMMSSLPLCPFRWLTDIDCPLCGLSHAFGCLLTGNVAAALRYHREAPELFTLWLLATSLAFVHSIIAQGPWVRSASDLATPPTPPPSH